MSRKLLKNTAIVGGMTLISRVLGLVHDIVLARFGATAGMDAFFVAFKIPNFLRRLFAEGAFAQAFVPGLAEYREQRSPEAAGKVRLELGNAIGINPVEAPGTLREAREVGQVAWLGNHQAAQAHRLGKALGPPVDRRRTPLGDLGLGGGALAPRRQHAASHP